MHVTSIGASDMNNTQFDNQLYRESEGEGTLFDVVDFPFDTINYESIGMS